MPKQKPLLKLKQPDDNTGIWYYIIYSGHHYYSVNGKWVRDKPTNPKYQIFAIRVFPSKDRKHPFMGLHARTSHNPIKFNQTYLKYQIFLRKKDRRIIESNEKT
jgi:hypothetical protein